MIATLRDWTIQPVFGAIALFSVVYGQLGYSSYQNAMGSYSDTNNQYGSGARYGFSFNPEVGVVGPRAYGGGYEQLGVGQYPFVDPRTYWFLAGVSGGPSLFSGTKGFIILSALLFTLLAVKTR